VRENRGRVAISSQLEIQNLGETGAEGKREDLYS